ncbi:hypothetical protein IF1G_10438 [Cordyceps javanica]|uniref:Uncharacterized protein n=1 Tax=Cordyceps javanica TaxID=43265 RepID=A0A545UN70_9HYPO|nr:hypothetical protein IF1G_10438 [Cordyceps javanica]
MNIQRPIGSAQRRDLPAGNKDFNCQRFCLAAVPLLKRDKLLHSSQDVPGGEVQAK